MSRSLKLALLAGASLANHSAHAEPYFLEDVFKSIVVNLPQNEVFVDITNVSGSTDPKDFKIGHLQDEVVFEDIFPIYHCGWKDKTFVQELAINRKKTFSWPQGSHLWLGKAGAASSGYFDKKTYYHGIEWPKVQPRSYELRNAAFQNSDELKSRGNTSDLAVPIAKLVSPPDGASKPIDGETVFLTALEEHVAGGGDRVAFMRKNQKVSVDVPISFVGACTFLDPAKHPANPLPHYDTAETMVRITYRYEGDRSITYTPAVPVGGDGEILEKVQITEASIKVDPPQSVGICPRNVNALARLRFNEKPKQKRVLTYRFLKNGKPISPWMQRDIKNIDQIELPYAVPVEEGIASDIAASIQTKVATNGGLEAKDVLTFDQNPIIAIEAKIEGQTKIATRRYKASCRDTVEAEFEPDYGPDLITREGIELGGVKAAWGGEITLEETGATDITGQGCRFRYAYDVHNVGKTSAAAFHNRLVIPGRVAGIASHAGLAKGSKLLSAGSVLLPSGTYTLRAFLDADYEVPERNEDNNDAAVTVTVPERCGGALNLQ
ncbi:CARDB domain-containing protein [Parvularcula maris]|uniref:CARDB domain-containing protein n=1 Tax=Parvularcula maris TaxID=2965077 RepID=A0A9X2L7V1_9PROT|nr:CARDB domain-containing protein [Parvularcula maris]MCQ8184647.1 hypothetical protein [Parvularcula maris]